MKKPLPEREQEMLDLIQSLKAQLVERGNVIHFQKLRISELEQQMNLKELNEPVSTLETDGHRRPESTGPVVHRESSDEFSGAGGPQERTQLQTQINPPADTHDSSGNSAVDTGGTT